jgi:spore coat protein CotH
MLGGARKRRGAAGALLAALIAILLWVLPAVAAADEADQIYQPSAMLEIELALSAEAEKSLEEEPDEDVNGTFSAWLSDGTPGGSKTELTKAHPVKIHLKGHVGGSFRPLTGKAAFKLKFGKSERFLGLRKMTLNNMVEDPSMIHETLAYSLFRAAGVPASRTGFAYLRVNGEDFGVYLDIESLDETALARLYGAGNTLHLYEGEYGADVDAAGVATLEAVVPEGDPKFEMDEGEGPPADLEALANAVAALSPSFSARLAGLADLDEVTRMWAVEKYVSHWDGYSGEEAANKPNNYYLHSDLGGLFQMLPWGTDNTWQIERRIGFDGRGGLLFNGCLGDVECFGRYVSALQALQGRVATLNPDGLAASTAALLKPWQELEESESSRGEHDVAEIETAVAKVRQYIAERPGELAAWLAVHAPKPPAPPAPPASRGKLRLAGVTKHRRAVDLRLRVPAAGMLSARGIWHRSPSDLTASSGKATVSAPATVTLHCRLSAVALRRLHERSLALAFQVRLRGDDGGLEKLSATVRLPRLESRG